MRVKKKSTRGLSILSTVSAIISTIGIVFVVGAMIFDWSFIWM